MKKLVKKLVAVAMAVSMTTMAMLGGVTMAFAESSTGVGLCAHAMKAYNEDWQYVWGGTSYGAVDCSGLIWSYNGVGGIRVDMLGASDEWGYVSSGIPNIHGLGLHQPGHVGIYIGSGMAIDARDEYSDVVLQSVYGKSWVEWFKIDGVSYPSNGWVLFNGNSFYYENGEYIVNTTRTLNGVTYTFDSSGASNIAPPQSAYAATDYSSSSVPTVNQTPPADEEPSYETEEPSQIETPSEPEPQPEPEPEPEPEPAPEPEPEPEPSQTPAEEPEENDTVEAPVEENVTVASYGDENDTVLEIQKRLAALGYLTSGDSTTGYFGTDTHEAVVIFQNNSKIEITGIVDKKTYDAMMSDDAQSGYTTLKVGDYDDGQSTPITRLQTKLAALGYYTDDITGVYGKATECAVKLFQTETGFRATGEADGKTQIALYDENAVKNPNTGAITYHMQSALVTQVQARLIELRYYTGTPSEKFDAETLKAVNAFQKAAGFEEAKILTAEQIELLNSDDAPKGSAYDDLTVGYSGDDVSELQSKLTAIGNYSGSSTSVYTEELAEAVKQFQTENGMEATGIADKQTREAINTEASRQNSEVGNKVILNTAKISDRALAGVAEAKVQSVQMTETANAGSNTDAIKALLTTAIVLCAAIFMTVVFMVEIKKYNAKTKKQAQRVRKF